MWIFGTQIKTVLQMRLFPVELLCLNPGFAFDSSNYIPVIHMKIDMVFQALASVWSISGHDRHLWSEPISVYLLSNLKKKKFKGMWYKF